MELFFLQIIPRHQGEGVSHEIQIWIPEGILGIVSDAFHHKLCSQQREKKIKSKTQTKHLNK